MSFQNMLLWQTEYFEMRLIEKQQMQEASLTSPFLPKSRAQISHEKDTLPVLGRPFLSPGTENRYGDEFVQTNLPKSPLFSINFPHVFPSHCPHIYCL